MILEKLWRSGQRSGTRVQPQRVGRYVAGLLIISMSLFAFLVPENALAAGHLNTIERLGGQTRFETMREIALKYNARTTKNVILATGLSFPDALAGVPLAKQKDAPLLLVDETPEKSQEALSYIKDHLNKQGHIYILGGVGAVSERFVTAIKELGYPESSIQRIAGSNRYETALEIAKYIEHDGRDFYLASGDDFPDALSTSVLAATQNAVTEEQAAYYKAKGLDIPAAKGGVPLLLLPSQASAPPDLIGYLNGLPEQGRPLQQHLHIVGGNGAVSDEILSQLRAGVKRLAPDGLTRTDGIDRYATMSALNTDTFDASWKNQGHGLAVPKIYLASGNNFPDALTGAVLAAKDAAPLVLVAEPLPQPVVNLLSHFRKKNGKGAGEAAITVLGASGAVSNETVAEADYLLNIGESFAEEGKASVIAGSGQLGFQDGNSAEAEFAFPWGLAVGPDGSVYVADSKNQRIRVISPEGKVRTLAGAASEQDEYGMPKGGFVDGPATLAQFQDPRGLALDQEGNLYVADAGNGAIRLVTADGQVRTLLRGLAFPSDLALSADGELYVSDTLKHRIIKVNPLGSYVVLAGGGYEEKDGWLSGGYADGQGEAAKFNEPTGLALGKDGTLFVADTGNQRIRAVSPQGDVSTLAGSGTEVLAGTSYIAGGFKDGSAATAKFNFPSSLDLGSDGTIYISDTYNHSLRTLKNGAVKTLVGNGVPGKESGFLVQVRFNQPIGIKMTPDDELLLADASNNRIERIQGIVKGGSK